jgi:Holliday junction resolvase RusA-like endonuclease
VRERRTAAPVVIVTVPLPWRKPPLAQNDRRHWRQQHRDFQAAKDEAQWAIRAARPGRIDGAEVVLHYRVPDRRRRDADGPAPTLKAVLDALVAEQVIPDDSWTHVPRVAVQIHPPTPGQRPGMWLTLTRLEETSE